MFTDVHRFAFGNEVRFTKHGTELTFKIEISAMVSNNNPGSFKPLHLGPQSAKKYQAPLPYQSTF